MAKADECIHEIWQLAGEDGKAQRELRLLIMSDLGKDAGESPEEKKIYEIRRKTQDMIDEIRSLDRQLSRKLAGDRSYYGEQKQR